MSTDLRPASAFTNAELAALFTAAYEGYAIPFTVDEPTFTFMMDAFDLDMDQSLVAVEDETAVGLANLGRRGRRTWLGGVGVAPARRCEGIGELLTRSLLDRAAALGATEMPAPSTVCPDAAPAWAGGRRTSKAAGSSNVQATMPIVSIAKRQS